MRHSGGTSHDADAVRTAVRKPLIRPFPRDWFIRTRPYRLFMARELTSVFIAGYLVFLLVCLHRLGQGPEAYQDLIHAMRHPLSVILHGLTLMGALWHSITWFNLTPTVMPLRIGEDRMPGAVVAIAMGYGPWLALSGLILWEVLRAG